MRGHEPRRDNRNQYEATADAQCRCQRISVTEWREGTAGGKEDCSENPIPSATPISRSVELVELAVP